MRGPGPGGVAYSTVSDVFHQLTGPLDDILVSVHPAHQRSLIGEAEAAHLRAASSEHHTTLEPPHWCDPSIAPVGWRVADDTLLVDAVITHWCSAVPARDWWRAATEDIRDRIREHAAAGRLDPVLSPRTSVNVLVTTADGACVGMRRSDSVTDPGSFDIPSEVLDHNDLLCGTHDWTVSFLDVARRAVIEELGVADIASSVVTAWAWNDSIAAALAFAHVRTPLSFAEVVLAWEGSAGRSEASELFPMPAGPVNPKVDFARRVAV